MAQLSNLNDPERFLKKMNETYAASRQIFSSNVKSSAGLPPGPNDVHGGLLADLFSQVTRGSQDLELAFELLKTKFNDGLTDDRDYLMEQMVEFAASLPADSHLKGKATEAFVKQLWGALEHPPKTYLSDAYRYRTADGSNNNRFYPQLGKAGSPYARTLPPQIQLTPNLPDPGLIFDEVFAREGFREHPTKISSMLFYLASIIIHDIFRTSAHDTNKVDSSSYLDLSPLYGHSQEEQDGVRSKAEGLGKLKPDVFAEMRLLGFPPGVCALLVCFNRFHNYIAEELLSINEGGRFTLDERLNHMDTNGAKKRRDEDLFQTARLVTCGLYINIILVDYVRTILNLNRTNSEWNLDPRLDLNTIGPDPIPQGVGNQVSVEFNLVYRWHSAISRRDEQWSIDFFRKICKGADFTKLGDEALGRIFRKFLEEKKHEGPANWTFGGLNRTADGSFPTEGLVKIMTASTEDVAGAFGPRNVPICMKAIEVLGIQQARKWNVSTLNEFRKYFGLTPHKSFDDITTNKDVAQSLETLYGHPDQVELYVGFVAEDAKEPKVPGSGLCPGYTVSRSVLADAVALVRGDRFYTVDYTAATLTNWGFNQVQSNPRVAGGGVFYKLLMKAFPGYYKGNSIYAMYPFNIPEENRKIIWEKRQQDLYDFDPPKLVPLPKPVVTYKAIIQILNDQERFKVPWGPNTYYITHQDYMLSGDKPENARQRSFMQEALNRPTDGLRDVAKLYEKVTEECIRNCCRKLRSGYIVDAVADVSNTSHAIAGAEFYHIPIKTNAHPVGCFNPTEFYTMFSTLFALVFLDLDESSDFILRYYSTLAAAPLKDLIKGVVRWVQMKDFIGLSKLSGWLRPAGDIEKSYGTKMIQRLLQGGKSAEEVADIIIPSMTAMIATQAQAFVQMLDLFLQDEYYEEHWPIIEDLSRSSDPSDFQKLRKYALEGCRLATASFGLIRNVDVDNVTIEDGPNTVTANRGERIFVDFVQAGLDERVFPNPRKIDLHRKEELYIHHGTGPHECLGKTITNYALTAQLKVFGKLKNLRRAPGPEGRLKYKLVNGAFRLYMTPNWNNYSPFPTTMKVMFDDFSPQMVETNGYANGHTNAYTNAYTNGYTNRHTNGHANGCTNGYMNGHTNGYTNGYTNGHTNGHTNGYTNGYTNGVNGHGSNGTNGTNGIH